MDEINYTAQKANDRKNPRLAMNLFDKAKNRVMNRPSLARHSDFILADWNEGDEHLQWVIKSSVHEILEWVIANQDKSKISSSDAGALLGSMKSKKKSKSSAANGKHGGRPKSAVTSIRAAYRAPR